ncbi:MAG: MSHA pilin protein MshC [Oceanicoccus sp.]|jgi:MSHA pilin protein MshC
MTILLKASVLNKQRGFSLVELVSVIVLLGIVSVYVAPRFFSRDGFNEYAVRDQIIAGIRLAQQRAMYDHGAGACYRVTVTADVLTVFDVAGNSIGPTNDWRNGITVAGVNNFAFYFNGLGSPLDTNDCSGEPESKTIDINDTSLSICLLETGYVEPC